MKIAGAFTTGRTKEETCAKLQELLECHLSILIKGGLTIPEPKFRGLKDLDMTQEELRRHPVVCITQCTVTVPC